MLCTWLHYRLSCFHYIAVTDKLHVLRWTKSSVEATITGQKKTLDWLRLRRKADKDKDKEWNHFAVSKNKEYQNMGMNVHFSKKLIHDTNFQHSHCCRNFHVRIFSIKWLIPHSTSRSQLVPLSDNMIQGEKYNRYPCHSVLDLWDSHFITVTLVLMYIPVYLNATKYQHSSYDLEDHTTRLGGYITFFIVPCLSTVY